ncbi:hypothetical protein [Streptomyces sp. NPDC048202]|uniref:hypothetical protein n=1 Tax=Streptomyces sp. NPDC048202 TaxID=3365514 RepID=UPI00371862ED
MRLIEQALTSKTGNSEDCEDTLVFTSDFAAVIDGVTDKAGRLFSGMTGGRFVAQVLARTISGLPSDTTCKEAVLTMTQTIAGHLPDDLPISERPGAVATIYSARRREVWQIGDTGYWYEGLSPVRAPKHVDEITVAMRTAVVRAELLNGRESHELLADDVGRAAILPLLRRQSVFANNPAADDLAYAVIDGRDVPMSLIEVIPVPESIRVLVLASDGYPRIFPTLQETEASLRQLLIQDPLCIGPLAGTKGVRPGNVGYDDRAYLRIAV